MKLEERGGRADDLGWWWILTETKKKKIYLLGQAVLKAAILNALCNNFMTYT